MDYFNGNSFLLGTLLFGCLYLSNILIFVFCLLFKIRIIEFGIFFSVGFSPYSKTINGIQFTLGWLPIGSFVKVLGANIEEKDTLAEEDLPYVLFNKPNYVKTTLSLIPIISYIIVLIIAVYILNPNSLTDGLSMLASYLVKATKAIFTNEVTYDQFLATSQKLVSGRSIILIIFALTISILSLFTLLSKAVSSLLDSENKTSGIRKWIAIILMIVIYWALLWKIPRFILSFFSLSQNLSYISGLVSGLSAMGLFAYLITLLIASLISPKAFTKTQS